MTRAELRCRVGLRPPREGWNGFRVQRRTSREAGCLEQDRLLPGPPALRPSRPAAPVRPGPSSAPSAASALRPEEEVSILKI